MRRGRRKSLMCAPALFALPVLLAAGQGRQLPVKRIGELHGGREPASFHLQRLLRSRGWIDGETVIFVTRYGEGDPGRLPTLAAELVKLDVDVLVVTAGTLSAARNATTTIPIVCPETFDPIAEGLTSNLGKPTGNVTGVSWQSNESAGKRLELARDLVPALRRVALITDTQPASKIEASALRASASKVGVELSIFAVSQLSEFASILALIKQKRPDVLIISSNALTLKNLKEILQLAISVRLPTISESRAFAERGVLLTFGPDIAATYERLAIQVDRILRGAKISEVPFEQPTQFELVVNMNTAKRLSLPIPEAIMLRATETIR